MFDFPSQTDMTFVEDRSPLHGRAVQRLAGPAVADSACQVRSAVVSVTCRNPAPSIRACFRSQDIGRCACFSNHIRFSFT
jgi:hypothetical protein